MTIIAKLKDDIVKDVIARGLKPLDKYYSTSEVREVFSTRYAQKAMKDLANEGVFIRRKGHGTIVSYALQARALQSSALLTNGASTGAHISAIIDEMRADAVFGDEATAYALRLYAAKLESVMAGE